MNTNDRFKMFFNHQKQLASKMTKEELMLRILELTEIAMEARARLAALNAEGRNRSNDK